MESRALDVTEQQVHQWIRENASDQPQTAALFRKHLADKPTCTWLGDWTTQPRQKANDLAEHASSNNALYQVVIYNIPNRDLGGFSAGTSSHTHYIAWLRAIAAGLGHAEGIIVFEPDALPHCAELHQSAKERRLAIIRESLQLLRNACPNAYIYLDLGHPSWLPAHIATHLYLRAGAVYTNGISLNVANSHTTEQCFRYGLQITSAVSDRHGFVIDTSRNGAGPPPPGVTGPDRWANVPTNRLGSVPTFRIPNANYPVERLHGLLWVKVPGESDGHYNGAPAAGRFWPAAAMALIGACDTS